MVAYTYYVDRDKITPTKSDEVLTRFARFIELYKNKLKVKNSDIMTGLKLRRVGSSDYWYVVQDIYPFNTKIDYMIYKDRVFLLSGVEVKPSPQKKTEQGIALSVPLDKPQNSKQATTSVVDIKNAEEWPQIKLLNNNKKAEQVVAPNP